MANWTDGSAPFYGAWPSAGGLVPLNRVLLNNSELCLVAAGFGPGNGSAWDTALCDEERPFTCKMYSAGEYIVQAHVQLCMCMSPVTAICPTQELHKSRE